MKEAFDKGKRERHNIKFTAKGEFYVDYTCELLNQDAVIINNPADAGDVKETPQTQYVWDRIEELITEGQARGFRLAGDKDD